jgi:N-acetylgalactosamine 4-sulfate 6-O-sulfotransferase
MCYIYVAVAELLREAQPYLKLIVMLRDPSDRLYSAFHYYPPSGHPLTPEGFDHWARKSVATWRICVQTHGTEKCVRRFDPQQLIKGMYAEFFPDWLQFFPREQLHVIKFEEYSKSIGEHLTKVVEFLGLRSLPADSLQQIAARGKANAKRAGSGNPMHAHTRTFLDEFYAPFNSRLRALLDDTRFDWS